MSKIYGQGQGGFKIKCSAFMVFSLGFGFTLSAQKFIGIPSTETKPYVWICVVDHLLMDDFVEKVKAETAIKKHHILVFDSKYYTANKVVDTLNRIFNASKYAFNMQKIYLILAGNRNLYEDYESKGRLLFAHKAWLYTDSLEDEEHNVETQSWEKADLNQLHRKLDGHYTWQINISDLEMYHRDQVLEAKYSKVPHFWFGPFQKFNFTNNFGSIAYLSPFIYSYGLSLHYTRKNKVVWGWGLATSVNLPDQKVIQEEAQSQIQSSIVNNGGNSDDSIALKLNVKGHIMGSMYLEGKRMFNLGPRTQCWAGVGLTIGALLSIYEPIEQKIKIDLSSMGSGAMGGGGSPPSGGALGGGLGANSTNKNSRSGMFILFNPYLTAGIQYELSPRVKVYANLVAETNLIPSGAGSTNNESRNTNNGNAAPTINLAAMTSLQTGILLNFRKKGKKIVRYVE